MGTKVHKGFLEFLTRSHGVHGVFESVHRETHFVVIFHGKRGQKRSGKVSAGRFFPGFCFIFSVADPVWGKIIGLNHHKGAKGTKVHKGFFGV